MTDVGVQINERQVRQRKEGRKQRRKEGIAKFQRRTGAGGAGAGWGLGWTDDNDDALHQSQVLLHSLFVAKFR